MKKNIIHRIMPLGALLLSFSPFYICSAKPTEVVVSFDETKTIKFKPDLSGAGASFREQLRMEVFPNVKESFRDLLSSFINARNAFQYGGLIALSIALPVAGLYGTKVFFNVLNKKLTDPKPDIVLPGSIYGRWDRIKKWWSGYKTPPMIFDETVKNRLIEIEEQTKNIRDHIRAGKKITYNNLLLYGEPGTGKTLFAQILADKTNMDFFKVTAASLLQSGAAGIKYFNELLDMAKRSKYGLILFVDEADALFVDRPKLNPDSDHYKVLNHILALTGDGSSTFMLIAATNHAYVMDPAMGRRFQDRVLMPLPGEQTRKDLINLYAESGLFSTKQNSYQFVEQAKRLLTPELIDKIAKKTKGLSHAEIKDMMEAMRKKALATKTGMITETHINDAIDQAIEKYEVLESEKSKREGGAAARPA